MIAGICSGKGFPTSLSWFLFPQQNPGFVRHVPEVAWEGVAQGHGDRVWRQSSDGLACFLHVVRGHTVDAGD